MVILARQKLQSLLIALSSVSLVTSELTSKLRLLSAILVSALALSACQTLPSAPSSSQNQTITSNGQSQDFDEGYDESYNESYSDDDYPIEPYIPPEETATPSYPAIPNYSDSTQNPTYPQSLPPMPSDSAVETSLPAVITPPASRGNVISQQPALPSHSELLERARQNSQQQSRQSTNNSSNLPAFRNLMQIGTSQLKSGNLTAAENSFTRAQRLAPKSSAVYFYLSQVALKKNQPRKAEAMARRGLTVSQDASRRRALWQLILRSGQAQNNARVIKEAQQALR